MLTDRTGARATVGLWFERNEKIIVCLSGLATAIGVLFAAASSFFAWQQLELINHERMTPYRAILYNTKLEKMEQMVEISARYHDSLSGIAQITTLNLDGDIEQDKLKELRSYAAKSIADYEALQTATYVNFTLWPSPVLGSFSSLMVPAIKLNLCSSEVNDLKAEAQKLNRNRLKNACAKSEWLEAYNDYEKRRNDIIDKMTNDLKTDKLQILVVD